MILKSTVSSTLQLMFMLTDIGQLQVVQNMLDVEQYVVIHISGNVLFVVILFL